MELKDTIGRNLDGTSREWSAFIFEAEGEMTVRWYRSFKEPMCREWLVGRPTEAKIDTDEHARAEVWKRLTSRVLGLNAEDDLYFYDMTEHKCLSYRLRSNTRWPPDRELRKDEYIKPYADLDCPEFQEGKISFAEIPVEALIVCFELQQFVEDRANKGR